MGGPGVARQGREGVKRQAQCAGDGGGAWAEGEQGGHGDRYRPGGAEFLAAGLYRGAGVDRVVHHGDRPAGDLVPRDAGEPVAGRIRAGQRNRPSSSSHRSP